MPCQKCDDGKWKFGKTGDCKYGSKAECEKKERAYKKDEKKGSGKKK